MAGSVLVTGASRGLGLEFARQALDAIAAGVGLRVIPWQMGVLARLLRILPNWVYDRAVSGRSRKARKSQ